MFTRKSRFISVLPTLLTAIPLLSMAADDNADDVPENYPAGPLEEIVVSEFRQANVIELDSSITVLNRETISSATLQHFEEMIALVPNMNWSGDGSRARYFQMRGIGELEQYEGAPNPSVGFIVDDIDLSGVGGISTVFDLERVEVLRGPQATRFGASALAGLVYIQSADPAPETDVNAEFLLGSDDNYGAGAAIGGGLGERFSGRFSIHHFQGNGFYDNVYLGRDDTNERNETVARGKLLWDMGNGWESKLSILYADFDNGYDAWSPENGRTVFSDNPGRDEQQTTGASLKFTGPLAGAQFVSITGIAETDVFFSYDGEWGNPDYWAPIGYNYTWSDDRERSSFTQEFRLVSEPGKEIFNGKTAWVLGVYGASLDESDFIISQGIYDDDFWCTPCLDFSTLDSDYDSSNYAVFGRLDSDLNDRLALNVGLRLERWEADYNDAFIDKIWGSGPPIENEFHPSEDLWGGDISLNYTLADGSHLYALVSRGYKAGGFNPSVARALGPGAELGPEAIAFDPEKLLNYEAGIKGLWLDRSLSAEVSLFYMDRQDMQLRSSAQFTDNPNDFVFITSNAEGHSYGLEAALAWQLNDAWRLHGSLGLLESKVDEYDLEREAVIEGDIFGRWFALAPQYTLNLGTTWAYSTGWMARLDVNAVDGFYYDYSHDEKSDSRVTVNLKVGKEWTQWAVHAWVRNLLDEEYHTRGFSFGLEPPWFERTTYTRLGDPRHYGVTVSYRY